MSSRPTETKTSVEDDRRTAYRRSKFVRTSSLESIRRLNTYICSQNYYYILPALLAWLRCSQNILGRCTVSTSSVVHSSAIFRSVATTSKNVLLSLRSLDFFKATVYFAVVAVFAQLAVCVYYLSSVTVPKGLVFLITCLYVVSHLNLKCLFFFLDQTEEVIRRRPARRSRKATLGSRTISNMNLL